MDERTLMKAVRDLRQSLGLTQVQMAQKIGLTPSTIYRYETVRPPRGPALAPFVALAEESNLPQLASTLRSPLEQMVDLLQTEYERLLTIFLNSLSAVAVIKDVDGTILWGNPEYERLTGRSLTDLVGKKISDVWPPKYATSIIAHDNQVVQKKQTIAVFESVPVHGKDHDRFTIRFPIFDETSTDVLMVGALGCYWYQLEPMHGRTFTPSLRS